MRNQNRGVAMVMVLSVLLMMGMLCTVFTTHARLNKHVAGSFADDVRAKLAAQSGLEFAVERLRNDMETGTLFSPAAVRPATYWGDVGDELGAPHPWVPLGEATNPSFAVDALSIGNPAYDPNTTPDPTPKQVAIDGELRGVSMAMQTGTYGHNGDTATLRILGTQGMININDGVGEAGLAHRPVTMNLRRIVGALGSLPTIGIPDLATRLIDNRPPGGWSTKRQVSAQFTQTEWTKISALITTASWTDDDVALPVPLSTDVLSQYPSYYQPAPAGHLWRGSPAVLRRGRHKDFHGDPVSVPLMFCPPAAASSGSVRVYGMDELNPTWIQVVERSPVSVNEASREVLIALLDGLQGFFMLEPRRRWPNTQCGQMVTASGVYWWAQTPPDHSPSLLVIPVNPTGGGGSITVDIPDEMGRLFSTLKIAAGPPTSASISADIVADEIIACRAGVASANFDYSAAWFGGPFATWRRFNAFCDNLVAIGVLADNRAIYLDVNPATAGIFGEGPTIVSAIQKVYAAQAIADVLKANFNPNLHLNETNPDRNLFTFVDKTDLIVNSTEFALSPSGTYEVESLGRVVRPLDGEDAFTSSDNQLMSRHTVYAMVRMFDLHRETSQKHFYDGTPSTLAATSPETSNHRSVEVGPEPDNGPAAAQNEWGGYLALPTIGGTGDEKAPQALESTAVGDNTDGLGSKAHGHFGWDDRLHHHADGGSYCADLSNASLSGEGFENYPAPGETLKAPYMPAHGTGSPYRLARSFRNDGTTSTPALAKAAPGNLRVDGLYAERHSGPSWWLSPQVLPEYVTEDDYGENYVRINGVISYWIKPTFFPEMSGKSRVFFDASLSGMPNTPHQFLHAYGAAHDAAAFASSTDEETLWPDYLAHIPPGAFMFGNNYNGVASDSLNHVAHDDSTVHSPLQGHRWVHVVLAFWDHPSPDPGPLTVFEIYVNGVKVGRYDDRPLAHGSVGHDQPPKVTGWSERSDGSQNAFRFGAVSKTQSNTNLRWIINDTNTLDTGAYPMQLMHDRGNHALVYGADSTIDEFYLWGENNDDAVGSRIQQALSLWQMGRYLVPGAGEGAFLSKEVVLTASSPRALAPATSATPPLPTGEGGGGAGGTSVPAAAAAPSVRVLGLSWTLYGEGVDAAGEPILLDHQSASLPTIQVDTALTLRSGGSALSPALFADGYSAATALAGGPLVLAPGQPLQYEARFLLGGADLNTILVATPVIDDVTIYYTAGITLDQVWMD